MPFVLVDVGLLGAALFCLLMAIALTYLVKAIASALPNLSILGVGLDLAKIFRDAGDAIVSWVVDNTHQLWDSIVGWISGHAYLLDSAFGAVVQAVSHLGDQIAHIVTEVVPNAIKATESYVGSELVKLHNTITNEISASVAKAEALLEGDVKSLADTVTSDVTTLEGDISRAVTKGVATAENYTDAAVQALKQYVDQSVSDAESVAAKALSTATTQLGQAITGVASTAWQDLQSAESSLEGDISAAAATAASATAAVASSLGQEIATDEQTLQSQIGSAVQSLTGDIASEAQTVAGDFSSLQGQLQAMITASLAGVLARVATLEECSVGVCEDSPNNFSNLLNAALGVVSLVGVGAFLTQVIDDPAQAEQDYADAIQGVYQSGNSALQTILSL